MTNSRPDSLLEYTFTRPDSTTYSESPTSPSLISTVLRGKARTTPVSAILRSVWSSRGATRSPRTFVPILRCLRLRLFQLAEVVDDLAVVRQLVGGTKRDFAAQLRDLANRLDQGIGQRRVHAGNLDVQHHP